jgi:hypothetical protein
MAANRTKQKGPKGDKLIRDALMLELFEEIEVADPKNPRQKIKIKKLRLLARSWVNAAIKGDGQACDKITDRVDGKVAQTVKGTGRGGAIPIQILESLSDAELSVLERIASLVARSGGDTGN